MISIELPYYVSQQYEIVSYVFCNYDIQHYCFLVKRKWDGLYQAYIVFEIDIEPYDQFSWLKNAQQLSYNQFKEAFPSFDIEESSYGF